MQLRIHLHGFECSSHICLLQCSFGQLRCLFQSNLFRQTSPRPHHFQAGIDELDLLNYKCLAVAFYKGFNECNQANIIVWPNEKWVFLQMNLYFQVVFCAISVFQNIFSIPSSCVIHLQLNFIIGILRQQVTLRNDQIHLFLKMLFKLLRKLFSSAICALCFFNLLHLVDLAGLKQSSNVPHINPSRSCKT